MRHRYRKQVKSQCIKKPKEECNSPCIWKEQSKNKYDINIKAHCRLPLFIVHEKKPYKRKILKKQKSHCSYLTYEQCLQSPECILTLPSKIRKSYCRLNTHNKLKKGT